MSQSRAWSLLVSAAPESVAPTFLTTIRTEYEFVLALWAKLRFHQIMARAPTF